MFSRNDPINRGDFGIEDLIAELLGIQQVAPQQLPGTLDRTIDTTGGISRARGIDMVLAQALPRELPQGSAIGPRTPTNPGLDNPYQIPGRGGNATIPGLIPSLAGTQAYAPNMPAYQGPQRIQEGPLDLFLRDIASRTAKPSRAFGILPKL